MFLRCQTCRGQIVAERTVDPWHGDQLDYRCLQCGRAATAAQTAQLRWVA